MFYIIAEWNSSNIVTRYNHVNTQEEAQRIVDRLHGRVPSAERQAKMQAIIDDPEDTFGRKTWAAKELLPLPADKQAPLAYHTDALRFSVASEDHHHQAAFWDADPANKTVSFNVARKDAKALKVELRHIRTIRNQLLLESDANVLSDRWAAMDAATKTAWTSYRQALRDLPANTANPTDVTWPTPPE
jgi:2,3-bisphosphoglycerate-independent phosphoglycerate mutase